VPARSGRKVSRLDERGRRGLRRVGPGGPIDVHRPAGHIVIGPPLLARGDEQQRSNRRQHRGATPHPAQPRQQVRGEAARGYGDQHQEAPRELQVREQRRRCPHRTRRLRHHEQREGDDREPEGEVAVIRRQASSCGRAQTAEHRSDDHEPLNDANLERHAVGRPGHRGAKAPRVAQPLRRLHEMIAVVEIVAGERAHLDQGPLAERRNHVEGRESGSEGDGGATPQERPSPIRRREAQRDRARHEHGAKDQRRGEVTDERGRQQRGDEDRSPGPGRVEQSRQRPHRANRKRDCRKLGPGGAHVDVEQQVGRSGEHERAKRGRHPAAMRRQPEHERSAGCPERQHRQLHRKAE
jgi:hypothetical protein